VAHRKTYARVLLDAGVSPDMPVAAIERATRDDQRIVRTTLGELGVTALTNPATIVIGEVVRISDQLLAVAATAAAR
jgi:siroheme synthase